MTQENVHFLIYFLLIEFITKCNNQQTFFLIVRSTVMVQLFSAYETNIQYSIV